MNRIRTAASAAFLTLAFVMPFEMTSPLVRLAGVQVTNVELVMYVALASWMLSAIATRPRGWTSVHVAVAVWAGVNLLSALVADEGRAEAVQFALRTLGGCAVFVATADLSASRISARRLCLAIAAGAVLSAGAAVVEIWRPPAVRALLVFKTHETRVGGFLRASGTFEYANTAAMYWEAALPVACAGLVAIFRSRAAIRWAAIGAALLLIEAVVLSASRAALASSAIVLLLLGLASRRPARELFVTSLLALFAIPAFVLGARLSSGVTALRLESKDEATWYRARYITASSTVRLETGELATIPVTVRNEGPIVWPALGAEVVLLSYHWHDATDDRMLVRDGVRTPLPEAIRPGRELTVRARVLAPARPGRYRLRWDMVHEDVLWFSMHAPTRDALDVEVVPGTEPPAHPDGPAGSIAAPPRPSRRQLWRAAVEIWRRHPVLGAGPDSFRHRYGRLLGLAPFDNRLTANSLYFETLANLGIVGLGALIGVLVTLAMTARKAWTSAEDKAATLVVLGVSLAVAAFFIHGVVDYFFEFTPTYLLFWMTAGLLTGATTGGRRP